MSADALRTAAELMRARAEAARPDARWVTANQLRGEFDAETSDHIASWHPTVALAVADWLEWEADEAERFNAQTRAPRQMVPRRALAVARTYLGDPA